MDISEWGFRNFSAVVIQLKYDIVMLLEDIIFPTFYAACFCLILRPRLKTV